MFGKRFLRSIYEFAIEWLIAISLKYYCGYYKGHIEKFYKPKK